ncbi:MAG TPA: nuclear transport factor 2 family protein [Solirubrobacterales bacterium]|nr:nuclear transport factor 2 family protein [Solirubrobacterales bacterium]
MSEELVKLVEKGYEAWNEGDRGWVLEHMDPDVRWITPPDDPDPGTYEGLAGVEQYWSQWRAAVGQLNFLIEEIIDAGQMIVVVARRQGRGEHSGLEVSDRVIQVFHFDENQKCTEVHEYYDRDAALSTVRGERTAGAADASCEPG